MRQARQLLCSRESCLLQVDHFGFISRYYIFLFFQLYLRDWVNIIVFSVPHYSFKGFTYFYIKKNQHSYRCIMGLDLIHSPFFVYNSSHIPPHYFSLPSSWAFSLYMLTVCSATTICIRLLSGHLLEHRLLSMAYICEENWDSPPETINY